MHTVAVLALHGVIPFDLSTPLEVFGRTTIPGQGEAYRLLVCGEARSIKAGTFDLQVQWTLEHLRLADTIVVPGLFHPTMPVSDEVLEALRQAAAQGKRLASICTGAFVLAAAGLLDGKRATTHWKAAPELGRLYPAIQVDPNVLYVDEGQVLTSAGAAAGLDLCLHMVRHDHGDQVAAQTARLTVMPLEREGGQAQFILPQETHSGIALAPLLAWLQQNLHRPLTLEDLAAHAGMGSRTLSRRFREQLDTSPLQWLLSARIQKARHLLETTSLGPDQIARETGFETTAAFRERFSSLVGTAPLAYRRAFGRRLRQEKATEHRG